MSILLGIGDEGFSAALRKELEQQTGYTVDEAFHVNYLVQKVAYEIPEIVILHDNLQSNAASVEEREQELLSLIEHWRVEYNDSIRVVFMCVRSRFDPFLTQLIARNVLDIFYDKQIPIRELLAQISAPPNFANVRRLTTKNLTVKVLDERYEAQTQTSNEDVPTDELEQAPTTTQEPTSEEAASTVISTNEDATVDDGKQPQAKEYAEKLGQSMMKATQFVKQVSEKLPKRAVSEETVGDSEGAAVESELVLEDDTTTLVEPAPAAATKATIIGTVVIGVAGVQKHVGSTYTALAVARYLAQTGYSVVVVECNNSRDFDQLHRTKTANYRKEDVFFQVEGIDHYKYRPRLAQSSIYSAHHVQPPAVDLNKLFATYEYVVMDYGDLRSATDFSHEFNRAHVRLVVCSRDEWKTQLIQTFLKANRLEKADCQFIIPSGTEEKVAALKETLHYDAVLPFPTLNSPYELNPTAAKLIEPMLDEYLVVKPTFTTQEKTHLFKGSRKPLIIAGTAGGILFILSALWLLIA